MTIDKSRSAFLAFAIFAISSIALIASPSASIAKPASLQTHRTDQMVAPHLLRPNNPIRDPFACMLLG